MRKGFDLVSTSRGRTHTPLAITSLGNYRRLAINQSLDKRLSYPITSLFSIMITAHPQHVYIKHLTDITRFWPLNMLQEHVMP